MTQSPPIEPLSSSSAGTRGHRADSPPERSDILKEAGFRIGADFIVSLLVRGSALVVLMMLVALLGVLVAGAWPSIREFGFSFLASREWRPEHTMTQTDASGNDVDVTVPGQFGALAFIYGTVVSSALALVFAVPLSLGAALFLVRIGPWLTPTFVKCGIVGLLITITLITAGVTRDAHWLSMGGGVVGLALTGLLMWIAWTREDPRIGPRRDLTIFLHVAFFIGALLLMRMTGANGAWSIMIAGAATALLQELGRAGVNIISFMIEFLAAIPSIAYGIWGLFVMVPFLGAHVEPPLNRLFEWVPFLRFLHTDSAPAGRDMFAAGCILAIMVLPIITAISRDVLRAVPRIQIEGTQALGATWWQSSWAMLVYGRSGLFGAIMLGLARAAGETMAVTMVIGNLNQISRSPFNAAQTMSSLLANEFKETPAGMQVSALIELGLVLLVMSLVFNVIARYLVVGTKSRAGGA